MNLVLCFLYYFGSNFLSNTICLSRYLLEAVNSSVNFLIFDIIYRLSSRTLFDSSSTILFIWVVYFSRTLVPNFGENLPFIWKNMLESAQKTDEEIYQPVKSRIYFSILPSILFFVWNQWTMNFSEQLLSPCKFKIHWFMHHKKFSFILNHKWLSLIWNNSYFS